MSERKSKGSKFKGDSRGRRGGRSDNRFEYQPPADPPPPDPATFPTIERPHHSKLEIVTRHAPPIQPDPPPVQHEPHRDIRASTYTIDQLRGQRHDRELAIPALFQFHAELQLYKRFLAESRRSRTAAPPVDITILQHRINTICLQLNRFSFNQVFQEILALGIHTDIFVISFVNVVFKQAVMNPDLALLFSMLSFNVNLVLGPSESARKMKELFLERCEESFIVPRQDTDKGTIILLKGIVSFAGHLLRDQMLQPRILVRWSDDLLKSDLPISSELLITLLLAGGTPVAQADATVIERLSVRVGNHNDEPLSAHFRELLELLQGAVPPAEQSQRELEQPELRRSPSIDKSLNGKYGSLFKRSGSIPLELAQIQRSVDESLDALVTQYFYSPDAPQFLRDLSEKLHYEPGERTAIDLLRAVVEQPVPNQMVVSQLVIELLRERMYNEEELLNAVRVIAEEASADATKGRKLVRIYAKLINQEIATFDQFPELFGAMREIWDGLIPSFFLQLDQERGDWFDDLIESEFWREGHFIDGALTRKFEVLKEWEMLSYLPHFEAASIFADSVVQGTPDIDSLVQVDVDPATVVPVVFGFLVTLDEPLKGDAAEAVKSWFVKYRHLLLTIAERHGDAGIHLVSLLL